MPLFEYRCIRCGAVSEFIEGVTQDTQSLHCRSCGSEGLERMLSVAVVRQATRGEPRKGKPCCDREERCDTPPCNGKNRCCC